MIDKKERAHWVLEELKRWKGIYFEYIYFLPKTNYYNHFFQDYEIPYYDFCDYKYPSLPFF